MCMCMVIPRRTEPLSYTRTHENGTQKDNFSSKGNVNPYTGKVGTKEPTH
jgi:hypothetical protein